MTDQYEAFKENTKPGDEAFAALNAMVDEAKETYSEIKGLEDRLSKRKEHLREVLEIRLPNKMESLGLAQFRTTGGLDISVKPKIFAHIKKDNRQEAIDWLDKNGHAGLTKRAVTVEFNKDQQDLANGLMAELAGRFAALSEKKSVHPSTLKAWAKEMFETGRSFPLDLFGARRVQVAQIPNLKQQEEEESE